MKLSPLPEMLTSGIISIGAGANTPASDQNTCQADMASSLSALSASVLNHDVYDSVELVVKEIPGNSPRITFSEADVSMSAPNVIDSGTKTTSESVTTYTPGSIRYSDGVYLRFHQVSLHLKPRQDKTQYQVEELDMTFPAMDLNNIDKHLVRHFEDLYRKAQDNKLSDEEKKIWGKVVGSIDYTSFSQEASLPQYEVGHVTSLNENLVDVVWIDGEKERFRRGHIPSCFTSGRVKKDDWFEALVKRGRQGVIPSFGCFQIIDPPTEYDTKLIKRIECGVESTTIIECDLELMGRSIS